LAARTSTRRELEAAAAAPAGRAAVAGLFAEGFDAVRIRVI